MIFVAASLSIAIMFGKRRQWAYMILFALPGVALLFYKILRLWLR